jgi:hypothetical protein
MTHQLYMWSETRAHILKRHDFYVGQIKARVLSNFVDIEGEARRFAEAEYERLGSIRGEDGDQSEALDRAQSLGEQLDDLRKQMLLGALAGCFHQWDKELREFLERELACTVKKEVARRYAWDQKPETVFDLLKEFGWDCRAGVFFPQIDACRLIVNVYKHGKGPSLERLAACYPVYVDVPKSRLGLRNSLVPKFLDHEWMEITDIQFDEIAYALRQFWECFPERLYIRVS